MNKTLKTTMLSAVFAFGVASCDGEKQQLVDKKPVENTQVEPVLKEPVFSYYKQGETKPTLITDETVLEFENSSDLGMKKFTSLCTVLDIKFPYSQLKQELEKAVNYSVFQNIKSNKTEKYISILKQKGKQSTEYFRTADIWYKNNIETKIKFINTKHILVAVTIYPMPATDPLLLEDVILDNLDFFDFEFKYTGYYFDDENKILRMPHLGIQSTKTFAEYKATNNCILFEQDKFLVE